ncbi:MAG: AAA family ATPase [Candidatus Micrarchaeota archaeon]|nr:AAA family ATPase [Candidatus Micrarchaeota archaeon]
MAKKKSAILITGTPGTGKSAVAAILAKKTGAAILDINKVVSALGLYSSIDERDGARVVRLKELEEELCSAIKAEPRAVIAEGHLGCEMRLPVQRVFVLRCEPRTLRQRLASRGYPAEKIAANALSEALDYCTVLSEKNYGKRKVWEIDTTSTTAQRTADAILAVLFGKSKKKPPPVSFPDALMQEAISGEKIRKMGF